MLAYKPDEECPMTKTLKVVGSKWTMLLLYYLFEGKTRFGELQTAMGRVSPKTLSQRLQELQGEGIITKKVFAEIPPRVEYSLTDKGRSLEKILSTMADWGNTHG